MEDLKKELYAAYIKLQLNLDRCFKLGFDSEHLILISDCLISMQDIIERILEESEFNAGL